MISKNKIKNIRSLQLKKFRDESGLFVAEGLKLVADLATGFSCETLIVTSSVKEKMTDINAGEILIVDEDTFAKVTSLKSPQGVLAVFHKKQHTLDSSALQSRLSIALDDIQDPGNLGTIIRIADWFGITDILCSESTADAYNPKVVQASMGALARVKVHVVDLRETLAQAGEMPVYGTFLDGQDIYQEQLTQHGIIVMGNEGNGISAETEKLVTRKLRIPNFSDKTVESLNVSVATAIVCSEFRRRT